MAHMSDEDPYRGPAADDRSHLPITRAWRGLTILVLVGLCVVGLTISGVARLWLPDVPGGAAALAAFVIAALTIALRVWLIRRPPGGDGSAIATRRQRRRQRRGRGL